MANPFTLVVFGASGDLTRRKLIPAIFNLYCEGLLAEGTSVVGFARSDKTDESFRHELWEATRDHLMCRGESVNEKGWSQFASRLHYLQGAYDNKADYESLKRKVQELAGQSPNSGNCLFYLATPPASFVPIVRQLEQSGLARKGSPDAPWSRIVIEKPFGRDLQSAHSLNEEIRSAFEERQVFRIDHYLGKETVQNILVLRFANSIFEPIWNHKYVDHVQITVSETLGTERRGSYYDQTGAIRDIVQNHVMHLLCLVAMEPPGALTAEAIRNEKVQVLDALRPVSPQCAAGSVVLAQYAAGTIDGHPVVGYRDEPDVQPDSTTETFAAMKVFIDNWRWAGVPFYLRTGKRLSKRCTEISVHFKSVPQILFNRHPSGPLGPNVLAMRIQPDEGISLEFQVKLPGPAMNIKPLKMDFGYQDSFGSSPPDAYQRLLLDAAGGDATLFTRSDEIEAAWRFISPILQGCRQQGAKAIASYRAGTWGPDDANALIAADGNRWRLK